ncbi:MAG: hypothetical protein ACI9QN_000737 [Arcticibacterium sp.]|jgi:hypothetical protein
MDGKKALYEVLESSKYGSVAQAVASLTLFTHPETLKPLKNRNIFRVARNAKRRGEIDDNYMYDDNHIAQDVFLWANNMKKNELTHVQFNHIYDAARSVENYTCLSNILVTPSFLAKLTDKDNDVLYLLKYRLNEVYNYNPQKIDFKKPPNYDDLRWRNFLPYVEDIEQVFEKKRKKVKKIEA